MYERRKVSNAGPLSPPAGGRFGGNSSYTPREYAIRSRFEPCPCRWGGAILRRPAAPDNLGHRLRGTVRTARQLRERLEVGGLRRHKGDIWTRCPSRIWLSISVLLRTKPASMDAKQVWRAALGELQVSLR